MSKNETNAVELAINSLVKTQKEKGRPVAIFDPSDFKIVSPNAGEVTEGVYIGRWKDWTAFYGLKNSLKGNGYMLVSNLGQVFYVPDWKSLETKFQQVEPLQQVSILVSEIAATKAGETYIKTAVSVL